jgi:hypothetical protein
MAEEPSPSTAEIAASIAQVTSNFTLCVNCQALFRNKPGTIYEWEKGDACTLIMKPKSYRLLGILIFCIAKEGFNLRYAYIELLAFP